MAESDVGSEEDPYRKNLPAPVEGPARFGSAPGNLTAQFKIDTLNIHPTNLSALERLAQHSPDLASEIVSATSSSVKQDTRRYAIGAITAGVICCVLLICSSMVIIHSGFWQGVAFFLCTASVAAIVTAIFTGKPQDLSWTVRLFHGDNRPRETADHPSDKPDDTP